MNIWRVENDYDNFKEIGFVEESDWEYFNQYEYDGHSLKSEWRLMEVEIEKSKKELGDIPGLGADYIVVNDKALKAIVDVAKNFIEILPLKCKEETYNLINILRVVDCLDLEKTKYKLFKACDEIQSIQKYSLKKEMVENEVIFKMDKYITGYIFVTDIFKKTIEENNISGLKFTKIWSSEQE